MGIVILTITTITATMKASTTLVLALTIVRVAVVLGDDVFSYEGDNHQHSQDGDAGDSVQGEYSWTSPEGEEFHVKYVADDKGYRAYSDAIPKDHDGVAANGEQANLDGER